MQRYCILLLLAMTLFTAQAQQSDRTTLGIGVYPGRPTENFRPTLVKGTTHRNLALFRSVTQSSSVDVNLTGQLVTDGIVEKGYPATLTVSTRESKVSDRDKEKTIDENIHSSLYVMGADNFLEFDWTTMRISMDAIKLTAAVAYHEEQVAGKGYEILVQASKDGKKWRTIGSERGAGLPGKATRQRVSSDPNKQERTELLPLRIVETTLKIKEAGPYSKLRLVFKMPGCAYWRLYETEISHNGTLQSVLPSYNFSSAWCSGGHRQEWLCIDLGGPADIDEVLLDWIRPSQRCSVSFSDNGTSWTKAVSLQRQHKGHNRAKLSAKARYVKLLMDADMPQGPYILSEVQVMGTGGVVARPCERQGMKGARYYLNGGDWRLWRAGDTHQTVATVPATVLGSYMNVGAVPDNRVGNNMREISESYFNSDFYYEATFEVPQEMAQRKRIFLNFDGINWKAVVWVNGQEAGRIDGAFQRGRFDITRLLSTGTNKLRVQIIKNAHFGPVKLKNETSTDLNGGVLGADNPTFHASIGWDWITSTPGRESGIWNDVYLSATDGIHVSDPIVTTHLESGDTLATLTPAVWVRNDLQEPVQTTVSGWVGNIKFSKQIALQGGEEKEVQFLPDEFPQLRRQRLRLWWPVGYGEPYRYPAGFSATVDGQLSDSLHFEAGIREVTYKDMATQTKIYINGRRLVPLGGNWGFSETNLNYRGREYDAAVGYHQYMGLNMIRNWVGQIGDEEFYESCDHHGVMVWQDFWLANPWDGPNPEDEKMFMNNATDLVRKIRRHASLGIYCGRNEGYPPASLDKALRELVAQQHPGMGYISSSADDGVSGHGPYNALAVVEYFKRQPHKLHSERGMACVPNVESLRRMIAPVDSLWPQSLTWAQHDFTQQGAQKGSSYNEMIRQRFGEPRNVEDYCYLSQWINYDGYRAMYEASQQERLGLLIWMSHPCWPDMVWQTYDYYLEPTGAYFGVRKACEPLHIQYNPLKNKVDVVNISKGSLNGLTAKAEILDRFGRILWSDSSDVDIRDDQTVECLSLKQPDSGVWFLRLTLQDHGKTLSDNFYVESNRPEDQQILRQMPSGKLSISTKNFSTDGVWNHCEATVENQGSVPTLMIRLTLKDAKGEQILPVRYSDNYFSLMPGERKTVKVDFRSEDLHNGNMKDLRIDGRTL